MKPGDPVPQLPAGASLVEAQALRDGVVAPTHECVPQEQAVALEYNGVSHAVMLATPADLEDFALGFSLSEGLIDAPDDLLEFDTGARDNGIVLSLRITARCEARLKDRRRNLAGRTGCGLCGTDSLDQVLRAPTRALPPTRLPTSALSRAVRELGHRQPLQQATGGVHAAAWCALDGGVLFVREDVGRHNALDKLIGAMARSAIDPAQGLVAITSRASVEMVQKTALAGVAVLAAVSVPTLLAVQSARQSGLLLAGFVRGDRATIYCGAERLIEPG